MKTIFLHSVKHSLVSILGWGIGLSLLGGYLIAFYDTMVEQQGIMDQLIKSMPEDMFAFFGGTPDLLTPGGYLTIEFFSYMPLILGLFAALQGSGILAADEENGSLDLLLAHPVSRGKVFLARFLALTVVLFGVHFFIWCGLGIASSQTTFNATLGELGLPVISLLIVCIFFASLGLALSMLMPSRGAAGMTASMILVASYFLTALVNIDERLESLERFSPLHYYQSGYAVEGLNLEWILGLTLASLVLIILAWLRFSNRDIRISGEGGWDWLRMPFAARRAADRKGR